MRVISLIIVVLPIPGLPIIKILFSLPMKSSIIFTLPKTALPTRHVTPIGSSARFLIKEIRCKVLSIPARLSSPICPIFLITEFISF